MTEWTGEHAPRAPDPALAPDLAAEPASLVVMLETGDRIHYLDWGAPARGQGEQGDSDSPRGRLPPLLLLHGISQTAWSWAPVARRLHEVTRVLAMDLRGHGLSDASRSGYDLPSLAFDALTIVSANGWGSDVGGPPCVVAGHGFGAQVVASMAGHRPASVAGVALVDGGWEDVAEATRQSPSEFLMGSADPPEVMRSMEVFLADRRDFDPDTWDADQERAARAQVDQKHAGHVALVSRAAAVRGAVEAMFTYRPDEALAAVRAPLLIVIAESGMADDEGARERRLALDDVVRLRSEAGLAPPRIVAFTGVGHNLMRYRPDGLSVELLGLLEVAAQSQR